ncbi:MAG: M48 family metallopeptidase [Xanthomonadales bacterium]|nr:M48 family metallopeptidase [Xanthomonadales bacterium]
MSTSYETPELPEEVNAPDQRPAREFFAVLGTVLGALVLFCVAIWWSASWLARLTPFSWETALVGDQVIGPLEVGEDAARDQALQQLADRLSAHMDLPEGMQIKVHYSDSPVANAFATLGGHVIITRGLLEEVDSENALAMVLGHEIAHVQHRHPIGSLGGGLALGLMVSVVAGGSVDVTSISAALTQLSFSRSFEREADAAALEALRAEYGHLQGAEVFFQRMLDADPVSGRVPAFISTHPNVRERLATIRARQQEAGSGQLSALDPLLCYRDCP